MPGGPLNKAAFHGPFGPPNPLFFLVFGSLNVRSHLFSHPFNLFTESALPNISDVLLGAYLSAHRDEESNSLVGTLDLTGALLDAAAEDDLAYGLLAGFLAYGLAALAYGFETPPPSPLALALAVADLAYGLAFFA